MTDLEFSNYVSLTEEQEIARAKDRNVKLYIGRQRGSPFCYFCQNFKPLNAHHCSVCDRCIYKMDHHCVFINNCVGALNHRYFLQFLGFTTVACSLFCIFTVDAVYYNVIDFLLGKGKYSYCNIEGIEKWGLKNTLCYFRMTVPTIITVIYSLAFQLTGFVGCMFWSNFTMVSFNTYNIDYMKNGTLSFTRMMLWPFGAKDFRRNWRSFLGLYSGRQFWSHILLPSTHKTYIEELQYSYEV
ncbi:unnamed protein product [Bursaphelenchus okinawaensis]|uniref:Palmitoyltransferase n=1 Tax=Bursaphelenchus okinawaensis TaxID=465554 RepID=A0A811KKU6_9BILA|nr:unnamed protein product [Bursaphelenchus okinawaensis]CAG9105300.1 unnamed protein product [Bursaphelenchus okinawaensis]